MHDKTKPNYKSVLFKSPSRHSFVSLYTSFLPPPFFSLLRYLASKPNQNTNLSLSLSLSLKIKQKRYLITKVDLIPTMAEPLRSHPPLVVVFSSSPLFLFLVLFFVHGWKLFPLYVCFFVCWSWVWEFGIVDSSFCTLYDSSHHSQL